MVLAGEGKKDEDERLIITTPQDIIRILLPLVGPAYKTRRLIYFLLLKSAVWTGMRGHL